MTDLQKRYKRIFDIILASILLMIIWWLIIILIILASIDTKSFGLFFQRRIGQYGKEFYIFKIKTMINAFDEKPNYITTVKNKRITYFGSILRKFKLDEIPQIFNILFGDMSFVGPRPDVRGFANSLTEDNRIILDVRPGVTGPASLYYRDEEFILSLKEKPEEYNKKVIWPNKVKINKEYIYNWTLMKDIKYIFLTIFYVLKIIF